MEHFIRICDMLIPANVITWDFISDIINDYYDVMITMHGANY